MSSRHVSLVVKVNIVIVALVLLTSVLLFVSSIRSFQKAVFDPCTRSLEQADTGAKTLDPYVRSLLHYIGTDELNAVAAQSTEDKTSLREWIKKQPSLNDDPKTGTLLDDYEQFYALLGALRNHNGADSCIAQIEKDGKAYLICINDSNSYLILHMGQGDTLEFFGIEEPFLPPEDFSQPKIFRDGSFYYLIRCMQIDLGENSRLNLWSTLDMTDELEERRHFILRSILFILALTVFASIISILLMRRFVTRPIQRLAKAAEGFTPEEDGTYSREKVITADIRSRDEIGELYRDICTMQEGIVDNTQKLALMSAEKERIRTELDMAAGIQANALPSIFPAFPDRTDFNIYATMTPAKEVGGDFYDFFLIDDTHLGVVMADVSDKGVPAALFMMTARTLVQIYAKMKLSPAETLRKTNEWLRTNNKASMFLTIWIGILDLSAGIITAVNAGHEYPVLKSGDQPFRLLRDKHGFVIGVIANMKFTEYEIRMAPGDRLFLYTDGVPEARTTDNEMFGTDRMIAALNEAPGVPLEQLLTNVRNAVDGFISGANQFDDLTMLCLEYKGTQQS